MRILLPHPFSALTKPLVILLSITLALGPAATAFADGYNDRYRSPEPRDYQPFNQNKDRLPSRQLDIQIANLNTALVLRTMAPVVMPTQVSPKPIFQPKISFEPLKIMERKLQAVQTLKAEPPASQGLIAKVGNVIKAMGRAIAMPFQKIGQAVIKMFTPAAKPPQVTAQQAEVVRISQNLKPQGNGVFQAQGGPAFELGHSWEEGSTFRVEGNKLHLVEGTAFEKDFGPIQGKTGGLIPIRFTGTESGPVPTGIDFNHLKPGITLTVTSPLPIEGFGTIQPGDMTYQGAWKSPDGATTNGRFFFQNTQVDLTDGLKTSLGMDNPAMVKQASFALEAGLMRMKSAVVEKGGVRIYVRDNSTTVNVSGFDRGANTLEQKGGETCARVTQVKTDLGHRSKAVSNYLDNAGQQVGLDVKVEYEFKEAFKNLADESEAIGNDTQALKQSMEDEQYDGVKERLETLQTRQEQVAIQLSGLETQAEAFRTLQRGLRDVTVALGSLGKKADTERMRAEGPISDDELARRVEKYFPEEKVKIATGVERALEGIKDLVGTSVMTPEEGVALGAHVMAIRDRLLAAVPQVGKGTLVKDAMAEGFNKSYDTGKKVIGRSADLAFFGWMGRVAETYPTVGKTVGFIGLRTAQSVDGANKVVGIVALGYFAVTATITTGAALVTAWGGKKVLEALGVNEEASTAYAALASFFVGAKVGRNARVQDIEGQIAKSVFAKAQSGWAQIKSFFRSNKEILASEAGHVLSPAFIGKHAPMKSDNELKAFCKFKTSKDAAVGRQVYRKAFYSEDLMVIGHRPDPRVARKWPGHQVLKLNDDLWKLEVNDAWIQGGIDRRATFYLASPQNSATLKHPTYNNSVFARELNQLKGAGYRLVGDYMYPPSM